MDIIAVMQVMLTVALAIAGIRSPEINQQAIEEVKEEQSPVHIENVFLYPVPQKKETNKQEPELSADAAISIEPRTSTVLFEKNAHKQRPIASITKLMVALVVLKKERDLSKIHRVKQPVVVGSAIGLQAGDELTIQQLLHASMIASANDATNELAKATVGSREEFIQEMNTTAVELGLKDTVFYNMTGLDREDDGNIAQENISSAFDIAQLLSHLEQYPKIWPIIRTQEEVLHANRDFAIKNTNELLQELPGIQGGKTGYTEKAGESLVIYVSRENKDVITVVLGSKDRFKETKQVTEWVYDNYMWGEKAIEL